MRRSRRIAYLTQSYETNSGQEKGELCCGGHPHIPRQGLRPCNPFLTLAGQTFSPFSRLSLVRYYTQTEQECPESKHIPKVKDKRYWSIRCVIVRPAGRDI